MRGGFASSSRHVERGPFTVTHHCECGRAIECGALICEHCGRFNIKPRQVVSRICCEVTTTRGDRRWWGGMRPPRIERVWWREEVNPRTGEIVSTSARTRWGLAPL